MASQAFNRCFAGLANITTPQGAKLSPDEIQKLRSAYASAVTQARQAGVPIQQAIMGAPKAAAAQLKKDIQLQQFRIAREVLAYNQNAADIARGQKKGLSFGGAIQRLLFRRPDGKSPAQSVESHAFGIKALASGKLQQVFRALGAGFWEDTQKLGLFLRAIDGHPTGVAAIDQAARTWRTLADEYRTWANELGADIGKLGDIYRPQSHDAAALVKAGEAQWVNDVFPLINRAMYRDELGNLLGDAEVRRVLSEIYETIATEGANKPHPYLAKGGVADRFSKSRELHLKSDGQAWAAYHEKYGGAGLLEMMEGHIDRLSTTIALLQRFGPNPQKMLNQLFDNERVRLKGNAKALRALDDDQVKAQNYLDYLLGSRVHMTAAAEKVTEVFRLNSAIQALKLGFAPITSLTDNALIQLTARVNGMSGLDVFGNQLRALNPADSSDRLMLENAGLMADAYNSFAAELNAGITRSKLPDRIANAQFRISGLNFMTKARRAAFGRVMMNTIGQLTRSKTFQQLEQLDRQQITKNGITAREWDIWRLATPERWGSATTMLTPQAIYNIPDAALRQFGDPAAVRREAASKLLGLIYDEGFMAVYQPRNTIKQLTKPGKMAATAWGAAISGFGRSMLQFKSFPIGLIADHWTRMFNQQGALNKVKYGAGLGVGMTLMGAVALQAQQIVQGKNPRPMDDPRFWIASAMKGGSFGVFGDFLFSEQNAYRNDLLETLAGPTIGTAAGLLKDAKDLAYDLAEGDDNAVGRFASGVVQQTKAFVPTYTVWYLNALWDHWVVQQLQEMANPGYQERMMDRIEQAYGQKFWWAAGDPLPKGPPDLELAAGQ